jgi:hypothetical protein
VPLFYLKFLELNLPLVVQELQIGGTSAKPVQGTIANVRFSKRTLRYYRRMFYC